MVKKKKVELGLPNYAIESEIRSRCTLEFAKKIDFASLKSEVDKLDIYKLKTVPTDLSNLT